MPSGALGPGWLEDPVYGRAVQDGRYCFITRSRTLACLRAGFPVARHGIAQVDVDAALIKDVRSRKLTRSIARWVSDLPGGVGNAPIDGVQFRSRHGDEIRMLAVFGRSDGHGHSGHISPVGSPEPVLDEEPELLDVFPRHGLRGTTDQLLMEAPDPRRARARLILPLSFHLGCGSEPLSLCLPELGALRADRSCFQEPRACVPPLCPGATVWCIPCTRCGRFEHNDR